VINHNRAVEICKEVLYRRLKEFVYTKKSVLVAIANNPHIVTVKDFSIRTQKSDTRHETLVQGLLYVDGPKYSTYNQVIWTIHIPDVNLGLNVQNYIKQINYEIDKIQMIPDTELGRILYDGIW
jgi:hypothetical protein